MNRRPQATCVWLAYTAAFFVMAIWAWISPAQALAQLLPLPQPGSLIVTMTSPTSGDTVTGTVPVSASVSIVGSLTVAGVQFKLDGNSLGAEDTTAPYAISWDTTSTSNGSHTLTAVARDALGVRHTSDPVTVTVFNDTTPPTVSITSPASGATVNGTVTVTADATDASGVAVVQFLLDGAQLGALDDTVPYEAVWDTTTVADGAHTLQARAQDTAGNIGESAVITVTVANGAADTTAPSVAITTPPAGATVSDTVLVSADASDDIGVIGVQFLLDGTPLLAEDTTAPFSIDWDTTTTSDGDHTLAAVARDGAGNQTTSSPVSVTVANDTGEPPPEPTVTRFEENDPAVSLTGSWVPRGEELATFSGGTAVSSDIPGAMASLTFTGTAVSWLGWRCEVCGIARVLLDGEETTVDTFAPTRDPASSVVFSATGLPDGSHTLFIEVTGASNPSAGAANIVVDAFDVTGDGSAPPPPPPATTRLEETDPAISYTGDWREACDPRASGGCVTESFDAGDQATLSFTGTAVRWISWRHTGGGIARVFVDGTFVGEADTFAPSVEPQAVVFSTGPLPSGPHTLTIEVSGTANPDADPGTVIIIDAFDVTSDGEAPPPPPTSARSEESAATFTGVWSTFGSGTGTFSGGTMAASNAAGSTASFTFTGTAVSWIGSTCSVCGIASVSIDGGPATTVDTAGPAAPGSMTSEEVFSASGLAAGVSHTIVITVTGETTSDDAFIAVDAFDVTSDGEAPPPADDTTPPAVALTSPADRAEVSGTITVTADASDASGINVVQFLLDGVQLGELDSTAPFETPFDTTMVADGPHTLQARAQDTAGNVGDSAVITVTVANGAPDEPPPGMTTRFEESAASFTGVWSTFGSGTGTFSGGTMVASNAAGSTASFTFTGTAVSWIGSTCTVCGIASVSIDGGPATSVDTVGPAAPGSMTSEVVFTSPTLAAGSHTIVITVTGETSSGDDFIAVDAFDVTS